MSKGKSKPLLFTLFSSFLLVLIIPCITFLGFYLTQVENNIYKALKTQGNSSLTQDVDNFQKTLNVYFNKADELINNEIILSALNNEDIHPQKVYNALYNVMKGDTYLAAAHLESLDGKIKYSTHNFPQMYDLRIHNNTWDEGNVLSQITDPNEYNTYITVQNNSLELSNQVVLSFAKIIIKEDKPIGVVIIDLFFDAFVNKLNSVGIFSQELLIDTNNYHVTSLLHSRLTGSFADFPELSNSKLLLNQSLENPRFEISATPNVEPFNLILKDVSKLIILVLCIGVVVAILTSLILANNINNPIKALRRDMEKAQKGNLDIRFVPSKISDFNELGNAFNNMLSQISQLLEVTREEEAKLAESEKKALESQLNPHFLFNTLNTIKAIARLNGEKEIYTITLKLGALLRSSISHNESECTILESLQMAEDYLTIQHLRFGDKLKFVIECDKTCEYVLTPRLIIQPLVENAIIHGLEEKEGDWLINIKVITLDKKRVTITVEDNGVGIEEGVIPDNLDELKNSSHVGVYNIYRRLKLRYKEDMEFNITSLPLKGTIITISLPYICKKGIS